MSSAPNARDIVERLRTTIMNTLGVSAEGEEPRLYPNCAEAADEIERLRTATIYHSWEPIETAPVLAYKPDGYNGHWRCLIQDEKGDVSEGWSYWVPPRRGAGHALAKLRWATKLGQCFPKYWMPLPAPKIEAHDD